MSIRVSGNLYSGRDARRHQVTARCEPDGTIHFDDFQIEAKHIDAISVSDPVGNIPRTLRLDSGELFETNDHKKLNKWLNSVRRQTNYLHTLESNWRFVIASLAALAIILFVAIRWGIPAASESIADRLPEEVSATIGAGALEALDESLFEPSALSSERREAIQQAFYDALPANAKQPVQARDSGISYQLAFRGGGPIGANAFALPNGTIVVTDELIALAKNDDEILSVLLHEMGHVHRRHSLRMLISHSGLAMISLAIVGDVSSAGALVLALPSILVESSYSRDLESEADDYALARMRELNIETQHFANLMLRLENCAFLVDEDFKLEQCEPDVHGATKHSSEEKLVNYLSTHPTTQERIAKFKNLNN